MKIILRNIRFIFKRCSSCQIFFPFFIQDQKFSEVDIKALSNQRDMLLEKLDEFELANKNLRRLLREAQKRQVSLHMFIMELMGRSIFRI